jgi:hypothetical protein
MEDEERAHRDVHFQEELESLKASLAHLTSLLEQTLRNASGEGPSNRLVFLFSLRQQLNLKKQWVNMVKNLHTIQHFYTQRHWHPPLQS